MKSLVKLNNTKKIFYDFLFCDGGDDDPRHEHPKHEELSYRQISDNIAEVLTPEELITFTSLDSDEDFEQQLAIYNKAKDTYYQAD